jgi:plastocyanin
MKHLALLAIYALIAALVLPGSILAQDEVAPAATETTPGEPAAPEPAPAEPAPSPPEPQFLADERAEAPNPQPKAIAAAGKSISVADFSFTPSSISVDEGDTVTWTNNGPTPHSATANNGSFDTGILQKGRSGSHTFNEAGTFSYFCTPHPFMKGTVVVQASESGGGDTSGSGSGDSGGTTGGTGAEASQSDGGPTLPNSGADAGALLILGALMLLLGVAVHRRSAAREPRPTGRIGW